MLSTAAGLMHGRSHAAGIHAGGHSIRGVGPPRLGGGTMRAEHARVVEADVDQSATAKNGRKSFNCGLTCEALIPEPSGTHQSHRCGGSLDHPPSRPLQSGGN